MKSILKNKKILILIIVIILIIIASISIYFTYHNKRKNINEEINKLSERYKSGFKDYEEEIEYGEKWTYEDFLNNLINKEKLDEYTLIKIKIDNKELSSDEIYKFNDIGEKNISINIETKYTYKILKEKNIILKNIKDYKLIVKDTNMPVLEGVKNYEIVVDEKLDLTTIKASDIIDGNLEVEIEGNLDTTKSGEYVLKAIATDKNGNKTEQEFKVTVKEKKVVNNQNTSTNNSSSGNTSSNNKPSTSTNSNNSNDASTKEGRLNLATSEAKKIAALIIKPGMSDYEKAYAIYNYLHSNVALQTNQSTEAYKTNFGNEAYAALIMKIAACSGFCKAVTLLCNEAGLQSQHINAGAWTHQWNKVLIDGEWIILDAQGGIFGGTVHILEQ